MVKFHAARHAIDYATAAMEQMELYCAAHPGSPSAVRRPRLFVRGDVWVALLRPPVEEGIVGIGPTVTAALRAFDAQYLAGLRPPAERSHLESVKATYQINSSQPLSCLDANQMKRKGLTRGRIVEEIGTTEAHRLENIEV